MNRRKFLKSAALLFAASQLPLPAAPIPRAVAQRGGINPAWINAPYEIRFLLDGPGSKATPVVLARPASDRSVQKVLRGKNGEFLWDYYPMRLDKELRVVPVLSGD